MLFTELEGWLRLAKRTEVSSIPDLSNLDIVHILPRSWYDHWVLPEGCKATFSESQAAERQELVCAVLSDHYQAIRRRAKAIPTLGNLTLLNLSVNREAQSKVFATKKQLLIANTMFSLNGDLLARTSWDEDAITLGAKRLAEVATQLYPR